MKINKKYLPEYVLIFIVMLLTVTGFWNIYFKPDSRPNLYHHLHVITNFTWLFLLLYQLNLIGNKNYLVHRKIGLSILFVGPLLFASVALLSVHSAYKGVSSGQGDFLIVQNVTVTLETGLLILLAFIFRKQRKLHGAFLMSTVILFMGIALFFTLISFVPHFKIEGPETFYRFKTAGVTGRYVCLLMGLLFFLKDRHNGWPYLLAGSLHSFNEFINKLLAEYRHIQPLTETVGSFNPLLTFFGSFSVLFLLLSLTGVANRKHVAKYRQPSAD